jgi:hypothetical protein
MTDEATVAAWVTAYRTAWGSNLDEDIRALFTDDGEYLGGPSDTPIVGADAIVASWISQAEKPDDTTFEWQVIGVDGDTGFVQGTVDYVDGKLYDNLWVIRFADDGRARSFTEWWMKRPGSK